MILKKWGDITLEQDDISRQYAVFRRVRGKSGCTLYWQQVSRWYIYYRYAEKCYNSMCKGEN